MYVNILGRSFQPHESHVPFSLQFLMDYNLQGMNFIHLKHVMFRQVRCWRILWGQSHGTEILRQKRNLLNLALFFIVCENVTYKKLKPHNFLDQLATYIAPS